MSSVEIVKKRLQLKKASEYYESTGVPLISRSKYAEIYAELSKEGVYFDVIKPKYYADATGLKEFKERVESGDIEVVGDIKEYYASFE